MHWEVNDEEIGAADAAVVDDACCDVITESSRIGMTYKRHSLDWSNDG